VCLIFCVGLTIAINPPEKNSGNESKKENSNPVVFVSGRNCKRTEKINGMLTAKKI
jgi:hypothetical protein